MYLCIIPLILCLHEAENLALKSFLLSIRPFYLISATFFVQAEKLEMSVFTTFFQEYLLTDSKYHIPNTNSPQKLMSLIM